MSLPLTANPAKWRQRGSAGRRVTTSKRPEKRRLRSIAHQARLAANKKEAEARSEEREQDDENFDFQVIHVCPAPAHDTQPPSDLSVAVMAHLPATGGKEREDNLPADDESLPHQPQDSRGDSMEKEDGGRRETEESAIEDMDEGSNGGVPSALTRAVSPSSRNASLNVTGGLFEELQGTPTPAPAHEQRNNDRFKRPLPERLIRPRRGSRVFNQQEWELLVKAFLDLPVGANGMPENGHLTELAQQLGKPRDKVRSWFTETKKQLLPGCIKKRTSGP